MVVQHNITAMNANRMLGVTTSQQSKTSEKLSSGYRINRAADDAAGLTISEKMRKQIKGLDQASTNAQDGVSAVQTAEGALTEVHSMLQRMNELAVQAANGTNSQSDREAIQAEIDQLTTEIDRVAETTKFNETYLLKGKDGDTDGKTITMKAHDAGISGEFSTAADGATATLTVKTLQVDQAITIGGKNYTVKAATDMDNNEVSAADAYKLMQDELMKANNIGNATIEVDDYESDGSNFGSAVTATGITNDFGTGTAASVADAADVTGGKKFVITLGTTNVAQSLSFNLHVGADADMTNKIGVNIETMNSTYLGVNKLDVVGKDGDGKNINDGGTAATYAIDAIADAVAKVSAQRSALGAVQNRLEHTINNLDNVVENTTAAESRIRDTDMAETMVTYSKNNILAQAGQSMLAQANQSNQGVLSLLQ